MFLPERNRALADIALAYRYVIKYFTYKPTSSVLYMYI